MLQSLSANPSRRSGKVLLGAVFGIGVLAVLGFAAYKILFGRPGEAAAAYIPSDASLVVTIDLTPSDRQAPTFDKISQALEDQGIGDRLDGFLKSSFDKDALGAAIRPHLKRNFAFALWGPDQPDPAMVCLMAVDDPAAVKAALDSKGKPGSDGIYSFNEPMNFNAAVMDQYLVFGNSAEQIRRVQSVRADSGSSVASLPAFVEARASLPKDANVMVFLSAKLLESLPEAAGMPKGQALKGTEWMAYSATVEPDGIAFDYHCPFDQNAYPGLAALGNGKEFAMTTLNMLPSGAYGVMGVAQAGNYWNVFQESTKTQPDEIRSMFEKGLEEFKKQSGLDVAKDIVPALQGEQIIACYPGPTGEPTDLDLVIVATNTNGANPAALAQKVRAVIERESAKANQPVRFTESKIGDVTVWEVDKKSRDEMVRGIYGYSLNAKEMPAMAEGHVQIEPSYGMDGNPSVPPPFETMPIVPSEPPRTDPAKQYKDKSMLLAIFKDKVAITSSRALLNQMVALQGSGKGLGDSEAYIAMGNHVLPGSQSVFMVDVKRIMETLRPMLEGSMEGGPVDADDILNLFGAAQAGMVGSGFYDGAICKGRFFMPLDWERLVKIMGKGMKSMSEGPDMSGMPEMGAPPEGFSEMPMPTK